MTHAAESSRSGVPEGPLSSPDLLQASAGYAALSSFAFSVSLMWNSVHPLLLPILVVALVGDEAKNSTLGLITFVGLMVAMVVQPVAGALSDNATLRLGRRRPFIVGGAAGSAVLLLFLGAADTLLGLLAVYVVLQAVFNFALAAYQGLIPDLVPPNRRGVAAGAKNFAEILGVVVAALVISSIITEQDTHLGFLLIIAALAVATPVTCLVVRELPSQKTAAPGPMAAFRSAFSVKLTQYPAFCWMLAGRMLFLLAMTSIQTFALFYIRDVLQPEDSLVLWRDLTVSIGVAILVVAYPAGLLADRVGRKPVILVAGAFGAAGGLGMLTAADPGGVRLFGTLIGIAIGLFLTADWALATDLIPAGEGARFLGLTNLATAGGAALARLNGPLIDGLNGVDQFLGYRAMLLLVGLCFAAGGLLVLKVKTPAVPAPAAVS